MSDIAQTLDQSINFTRLSRFHDNLINFVNSLGTAKDPTTAAKYHFVELDRNILESAYRSDWIARRVIDCPAEDATRRWRNWNASNDQIELLEHEEKRLELKKKLRQWMVRARLYGGAALVMGVDDGHESWEPLDLDNIGKDALRFVVVMNRWELNAGPRIYNVSSRWYTRPEYYTVTSPIFGFYGEPGGTLPGSMYAPLAIQRGPYAPQAQGFAPKNPEWKQPSWTSLAYERPQGQSPPGAAGGQVMSGARFSRGPPDGQGDHYKQVSPYFGMVRMHPSRVIELWGNELPDWRLAPMGGGWGDSVLQTVDEALKDWGLTVGSTANMINDAKTDVIKLKDFAQRVGTQEYRQRMIDRFSLANVSKSTINALLLDSEEEWQRIQTSFSGLAEILREYMVVISGASQIPISRLFGQSSGRGLGAGSSGGEQDMHNYFDYIQAYQHDVITPVMLWLDQALIRSTFGKKMPDIDYEWAPLWQMSETEKADVALKKAQRFQIDVNVGLINENALRRGRVNELIEDGTLPGFEKAIEEFGEEPDIPESRMWSPSIDPNTGLPIAAPKPPMGAKGDPQLPPPKGMPPEAPEQNTNGNVSDAANGEPFAAGVMFMTPDKHVLLVKRSDSGLWSIPAGRVENGENGLDAASREAAEEIGRPGHSLVPYDRRTTNGIDFATFRQVTPQQFEPVLNEEHTAFQWAKIGKLPSDLHPGLKATLKSKGLHDAAEHQPRHPTSGQWFNGSLGSSKNTRRIMIVRHGATALNNESYSVDRIRGWKDVPLNKGGKDEAKRLGHKIADDPPDAIASSDLARASDTAAAIAQHCDMPIAQTTKALRPWNVGKYAGKRTSQALPLLKPYVHDKPDDPVEDGESFNSFKKRFFSGLSDVLDKHDGRVAIVTHHRNERLLKAWQKAGFPNDGSLDLDEFAKKGEPPGSTMEMDIPVDRLRSAAQLTHADAEPKVTKATVNYRPGTLNHRCGLCAMFVPRRSCTHVEGVINAYDTCDDFERKD